MAHEQNNSAMLAQHIEQVLENWRNGLERANYDGVWISAGAQQFHFQDDHGPSFKPNPYFTQWVDPKYAQPGACLLIRPGMHPSAVLFTTQPDDYWHAAAPTPDYLADHVEVQSFSNENSLFQARQKLAEGSRLAYIGNDTTNERLGELNPPKLLNYCDYHRATKTPWEQEQMRAASLSAAHGHIAAEHTFYANGTEFDVHMAYLTASKQTDNDVPYSNIVALNEHAATLHYQLQARVHASPSRSLLIDAGAQAAGYASDITRTYAQPGSQHGNFSNLIDLMEEHQQAILAEIRPGISYANLHHFMHQNLARVLHQANLLTASPEAALSHGVTEAFCPHGLGHLLGIQVHDVGGHLSDSQGTEAPPPENYPALRFTRTIDVDQIFTIEPGLYFIDQLLAKLKSDNAPVNWDTVAQLKSYGGIRIEDNVRVLNEGVENLTRDAWLKLSETPIEAHS